MKAESHKLIAQTVYNTVKQELGIELNLKLLQKGSYIPDYHYFWRLFSHRKQHLFDDVCLQINYISRLIRTNYESFINVISYRLGVISHFICDFFTAPHNFFKKTELPQHIKYESDLNIYIVKNVPSLSKESIEFKENFKGDIFDIRKFINKLHKEYNQINYSFETDLKFAIKALTTISLFLIDKSINIICPHDSNLLLCKKIFKNSTEKQDLFKEGCKKIERNYIGRKVIRMHYKAIAKYEEIEKTTLIGKGTLKLLVSLGNK